MVDAQDKAHTSISFRGFLEADDAESRVDVLVSACQQHMAHIKFVRVGHFTKGPFGDRKLSDKSYVQFHDRDSRNAALAILAAKSVKSRAGATLKVERTKTQMQVERNFHLFKAKEMLTAKFLGQAVAVGTEMPIRKVTVGGTFMFEQRKEELKGTFIADASDMVFAK